ncbi:MAG TPA: universal stress protein [Caldilineaceae bacterium]|nr:universal stress protein [Caldilineaceae bacterium]
MTELRRLLLPLDGSALAENAIPLATLLAKTFDGELILLRVLDLPLPTLEVKYPENHWVREAMQANFREAQRYLDDQGMLLKDAGIRVRTIVRDGPPAEDILATATDEAVDLIVISSHGKGGPSPWTSGSVADKVMQHSRCPVLLVRNN